MPNATRMPKANLWLCHLLETVKTVVKSPPVAWIHDSYSVSDVDYVKECVESCKFDTEELQKELYTGFKAGTVALEKKSCIYGSILVLYEKSQPWAFPYAAVGRVLQLFYRGTPFRLLFFGSQKRRLLPAVGSALDSCHINGGYTYPCNPQSIVIYRREEVVRVLIHEVYHASCSDPKNLELPFVEADTEAWAEITLCALAARGREDNFRRLWKAQVTYAASQAALLANSYSVKSPEDYTWRYTIGKLSVWEKLGLTLPVRVPVVAAVEGGSLRLTLEMQGVEDNGK